MVQAWGPWLSMQWKSTWGQHENLEFIKAHEGAGTPVESGFQAMCQGLLGFQGF